MFFSPERSLRSLGWWLLICCIAVFLMVVVGGITRLTQSGLSMVEWAPLMGVLPPLNELEWQQVFDKYRQYPEYLLVNKGMSLDEFKSIFWWEYIHRVLGRGIGVLYFVPLVVFWLKGAIPKKWIVPLVALFFLGAAQGVLGWYMVKSGLVDVPHVSQYRLTAHLGLAILIFSYMFWLMLEFLYSDKNRACVASNSYLRLTLFLVLIIFCMILSGGVVAGTKAGFIMNTFPTMNGEWLPKQIFAQSPVWKNFFENPVAIQFFHRVLAVLVFFSVLIVSIVASRQRFKTAVWCVLCLVCVQVLLGISTLVLRVPVWLGAMHQAGAVALLAGAIFVAHRARRERI